MARCLFSRCLDAPSLCLCRLSFSALPFLEPTTALIFGFAATTLRFLLAATTLIFRLAATHGVQFSCKSPLCLAPLRLAVAFVRLVALPLRGLGCFTLVFCFDIAAALLCSRAPALFLCLLKEHGLAASLSICLRTTTHSVRDSCTLLRLAPLRLAIALVFLRRTPLFCFDIAAALLCSIAATPFFLRFPKARFCRLCVAAAALQPSLFGVRHATLFREALQPFLDHGLSGAGRRRCSSARRGASCGCRVGPG
jgi:hypothetical protein